MSLLLNHSVCYTVKHKQGDGSFPSFMEQFFRVQVMSVQKSTPDTSVGWAALVAAPWVACGFHVLSWHTAVSHRKANVPLWNIPMAWPNVYMYVCLFLQKEELTFTSVPGTFVFSSSLPPLHFHFCHLACPIPIPFYLFLMVVETCHNFRNDVWAPTRITSFPSENKSKLLVF